MRLASLGAGAGSYASRSNSQRTFINTSTTSSPSRGVSFADPSPTTNSTTTTSIPPTPSPKSRIANFFSSSSSSGYNNKSWTEWKQIISSPTAKSQLGMKFKTTSFERISLFVFAWVATTFIFLANTRSGIFNELSRESNTIYNTVKDLPIATDVFAQNTLAHYFEWTPTMQVSEP